MVLHIAVDTQAYTGGNKDASLSCTYGFSNTGVPHKRWSEVYIVVGDKGVLYTEEQVLAVAGLPILGEKRRDAWCVNRVPTCIDDSAAVWEVRCDYSTDVGLRVQGATEIRDQEQPTIVYPVRLDFVQAVLKWSVQNIREPLLEDAQGGTKDVNGDIVLDDFGNPQPVMNTVGEPLYPETERSITVLDADYYMEVRPGLSFDWNWSELFVNKVNDFQFFGAPVGCVLCSGLTMQSIGNVPYYDGMTGYDSKGLLTRTDLPDPPYDSPPVGEYPTYLKTRLTETMVAQNPAIFVHFKAKFKFRFWYVFNCDTQLMEIDPKIQGWVLKLLNQGNKMYQPNPKFDDPEIKEVVAAHRLDKSPTRVNLDAFGFPMDPPTARHWLNFNRYALADFEILLPLWVRPLEGTPLPEIANPAPCQEA